MAIDKNYLCEVTRPNDFDIFWDDVAEKLKVSDLNPMCDKDEFRSDSEVEVFQVSGEFLESPPLYTYYTLYSL